MMGHISQAQAAFSRIYEENTWGRGSGVGSEPRHTTLYVDRLNAFLRQHKIRSVIDYGCGDWQFSHAIDWSGIAYRGYDVVGSVVAENQARHTSETISFHHITDGLRVEPADLLICKDVLQHLPTRSVQRHLKVFKTLAPHLLITNDIAPEPGTNRDIENGQWRPLRLDRPPFSESFDVLLTWDIDAYGCQWTKQTAHLRGARASRAVTLRDQDIEGPAPMRRILSHVRAAVRANPPLASLARRILRRAPP